MLKFVTQVCTTTLLLQCVTAHPEWFQMQGLQQLISTPAPVTSRISAHIDSQPNYAPSLSSSLRQSPGLGYQPSQVVQPVHSPVYTQQNRAYGAPQRPVAQPLPMVTSMSSLAYPQSTTAVPLSQYSDSYRSNSVTQPPSTTYGQPVKDFWFKEGTPVLPCGYGAGQNGLPLPEYNTPHKKCVPFHIMCGWWFTCIMDV